MCEIKATPVHRKFAFAACLFVLVVALYVGIAWLTTGVDDWWIIDIINGTNVFYGDDAYRFFLARTAWLDSELYSYNFILPVSAFLDGLIVSLAEGDLFLSRIFHGVVGGGSLAVLWCACVRSGLSFFASFLGVLIVALTPRYLFTTLSFYGEFWLGIGVCFLLWAVASNKNFLAGIVAGILPLVRPEGIYLFGFVWMALVYKREWLSVLVSPLFGLFYLGYLLVSLEEFSYFYAWRGELTEILSKIPFNRGSWEILKAVSPWLFFPSILGLLNKRVYVFGPVILGGFAIGVVLQIFVLFDLAKFEERYLYVLFPIFALLWAAGVQWLTDLFADLSVANSLRALLVIFLFSMSVFDGLTSLTQVQMKLDKVGLIGLVKGVYNKGLEAVFIRHGEEALLARALISNDIVGMLSKDAGIDKVIVGDPFLFYRLDPLKIPDGVQVGYPATSYMVFHLLMDGQIFIQHSQGRKYSFIQFGEPDYRHGEKRALYIDLMPMKNYPNTWGYRGVDYRVYLFSYLESFKARTELGARPSLTASEIEAAWQQWLLTERRN